MCSGRENETQYASSLLVLQQNSRKEHDFFVHGCLMIVQRESPTSSKEEML